MSGGTTVTRAKRGVSADSQLEDRLRGILDTPHSEAECLAFFEPLTERQRRGLAPMCIERFKEIVKNPWIGKGYSYHINPLLPPARIAVFWTATFTEIKKLGHWAYPGDDEVPRILAARKPEWTARYVEHLLSSNHYWVRWPVVRELVRQRLCDKPDNPRYYAGMISGLVPRFDSPKKCVLEALRDDPDLLEDEVWRLFEHEGDGENTLANVERFSSADWAGALVVLSQEGKLSRERLLDSALGALQLGFNHYRAKWFFDFFDKLEPTAQERRSRADTILDLIGGPTPNVAKWAFQHVSRLIDEGACDDMARVVRSVAPLLAARHKKSALETLALLDRIAQSSPELASAVATVAVEGLGHEKTDVQSQAFQLVSRYSDGSDEQLREAVERYAPVVSASTRNQLTRWLEQRSSDVSDLRPDTEHENDELAEPLDDFRLAEFDQRHVQLSRIRELTETVRSGTHEIPAMTFDGTDIPRLDPDRRVSPITDLEELIDICARVVEDDTLVDEGERALDGLSRLCDRRPDDFDKLTGPLFKRVMTLLNKRHVPFNGHGLTDDMCGLVYCWVSGRKITIKPNKENRDRLDYAGPEGIEFQAFKLYREGPLAFLSRRCHDVADRVANRDSQPLLGAPTHEGGWIDPLELVRRIGRMTAAPAEIDVVQALLRLAPDSRGQALKELSASLSGEWLSAVKYALGAERIKVGKNAPLWIAAARSRAPLEDDPRVEKRFPKLGPDCGLAARYDVRFTTGTHEYDGRSYTYHRLKIVPTPKRPRKRDAAIPTQTLLVEADRSYVAGSNGSLRWLATIWPSVRESYFALGCHEVGHNLDWWTAAWHHRTYLEPLLDSDTPLRKTGMLLLLAGLAAREPGEHGLATDAAIRAIDDGRLGTDNLGEALAEYLPTGLFKPARWAQRFEQIAGSSRLHAYVVFHALQGAWRGDAKKLPRGYGDLLELMVELASGLSAGIDDPRCRAFLERLRGGSKAAKAARSLLALPAGCESGAALRLAIEKRKERLECWRRRSAASR